MIAEHIEFLVEEPSMEAFLRALLPRVLAETISFEIYPYQGKTDLLARLEERLRGYASWLPETWRIVVLVDCDDDDCAKLKSLLESLATKSGLQTRSSCPDQWQIAFRIPIEELEAWYFGDWEAVRSAYPRASKGVPRRAAYRDPDQIAGGTWEAFEGNYPVDVPATTESVGGDRPATDNAREIEVTPEMIEAGKFAWDNECNYADVEIGYAAIDECLSRLFKAMFRSMHVD